MTKTEALEAVDRLESLIGHFGGPFDEGLREFRALVFSLRSGPIQDTYFREKLADLEDQAKAGFSVRKFASRSGGLAQVQVWALGALNTARSMIETRWPA